MTTTIEYVGDSQQPPPTIDGNYVWSKDAKPGVYEATGDGVTIHVRVSIGDDRECRVVDHPFTECAGVWSHPWGWGKSPFRYLGELDGVVLKIRKAGG